MSLLVFLHYPTHVAIFTDTLATTPKGEALMFCNKSFTYPDLHMTMAVTGILQFGDRWNSKINVGMVAEDIGMLDAHTLSIFVRFGKSYPEKKAGQYLGLQLSIILVGQTN